VRIIREHWLSKIGNPGLGYPKSEVSQRFETSPTLKPIITNKTPH